MPDFVRVVDDFEYTQTQKVLVRCLKKVHFDRRRLPDAAIYWRDRSGPRCSTASHRGPANARRRGTKLKLRFRDRNPK
jgi:hypothetical protein